MSPGPAGKDSTVIAADTHRGMVTWPLAGSCSGVIFLIGYTCLLLVATLLRKLSGSQAAGHGPKSCSPSLPPSRKTNRSRSPRSSFRP